MRDSIVCEIFLTLSIYFCHCQFFRVCIVESKLVYLAIFSNSCYCNKGGKRRLNDRKLIVVSLIPFFKLIWNLYCMLIVSLSYFNQASLQNYFKYKMTSFYNPTNGNIDFWKVFDLLLEISKTEKLNPDRMVKTVFIFSNMGF